jgi:hypothetical protein
VCLFKSYARLGRTNYIGDPDEEMKPTNASQPWLYDSHHSGPNGQRYGYLVTGNPNMWEVSLGGSYTLKTIFTITAFTY